MVDFCVELAGVVCRIRCRFRRNRAFFADYLADGQPLFTVEPGPEDLARMQASFDRMDGVHIQRNAAFLENNAIHALLAERLINHNALLMHGSALCMDGRGIIFTAASGTGKSTHARIWREAFGERVWMIDDDKPLIRVDELRVYGTPWNGKHHLGRNASAPLEAIVDLARSAENRIAPMDRADAFQVLIKQCFVSREHAAMARILDMEARLLDHVRFYALGCNMERSAALAAWAGIRQ